MAAAMIGALGAGLGASTIESAQRPLRNAFGSGGNWSGRIKKRGMSVASNRRAAKKARNVARNRAAHR